MLASAPARPRASALRIEQAREELCRSLPEGRLIVDPDILASYATDESEAGAYQPDLVVRPRNVEEVSLAVSIAMRHGLPVVPRGGGTGRAGGCLPIEGGLVLAMGSMNQILSVDTDRLTATVQPGVVLHEFHQAVEAEGLFYAPDPSSLESCHLGGNVATNASGPRNPKYGPTRDHLRGLQVVLPGGEVIRTGGHSLKGVAGFDLTSLLCGSEGTLGVITEVIVRLLPKPRAVETAVLFFPGADVASRAVVALMRAGHRPRALEMMDHVAVEAVRGSAPFRFPEGEQSLLILELDGYDREALFSELAAMGERAESELGASLVLVARSESERRDLWASRRIMSPSLKERWGRKFAEDIAVPLDCVPRIVEQVHLRAEAEGIASCVYGHAGDGNLHVNFLFHDDGAWPSVMRAAEGVFRDAIGLGGTITSEHGVGIVKRDFLPLEQSAPVIDLQRRLKRVFDPHDLMNPGKVFPPLG